MSSLRNSREFLKLTDSNYPSWSRQMRTFLKSENLWKVVQDSDIKSSADPDDDESLDNIEDYKAMSYLLQTIPPKIQDLLPSEVFVSSHTLWTYLKTRQTSKGLSNFIHIQREVFNMKMHEGDKI